jgi:hypothetical protein
MSEADEKIYILHYNTDIHNLEYGNTNSINIKYLLE